MTFRVDISDLAALDIDSIFAFTQKNSQTGANALRSAFRGLLERLERNPSGFPLAFESDQFDFTVREAYFKTRSGSQFRAIISVDGTTVHLLRVVRSSRRPFIEGELDDPASGTTE